MDYKKGEALNTLKRFTKWVAQEKPYLFGGGEYLMDPESGDYYEFSDGCFEAVKKPEPRKIYFFEDLADGEVFMNTDPGFVDPAYTKIGFITLESDDE